MGSENLFHKRKARKNAELNRQKKERLQIARYLIVCEGTKTEPYYLKDLADGLDIRPSSIKIAPNDGVLRIGSLLTVLNCMTLKQKVAIVLTGYFSFLIAINILLTMPP